MFCACSSSAPTLQKWDDSIGAPVYCPSPWRLWEPAAHTFRLWNGDLIKRGTKKSRMMPYRNTQLKSGGQLHSSLFRPFIAQLQQSDYAAQTQLLPCEISLNILCILWALRWQFHLKHEEMTSLKHSLDQSLSMEVKPLFLVRNAKPPQQRTSNRLA